MTFARRSQRWRRPSAASSATREHSTSRAARELLDTLQVELARLTRLVDNLLDLSRLQAGAARPMPELWTADELVAQALDGIAGSEAVELLIPEELPPVSVDAGQIQRALANVIENALQGLHRRGSR